MNEWECQCYTNWNENGPERFIYTFHFIFMLLVLLSEQSMVLRNHKQGTGNIGTWAVWAPDMPQHSSATRAVTSRSLYFPHLSNGRYIWEGKKKKKANFCCVSPASYILHSVCIPMLQPPNAFICTPVRISIEND